MPNPPVHINLARRAADLLRHDTIDANMGYYLLGSTSPDIRVITRKDRSVYHFAQLDFEEIGTGINGLFHSHPELSEAEAHSGATQAFMAGYLTHLLADETWIANMFRPYFGNRSVFEDGVLGLVMDRAMQLELDRRCWQDIISMRGMLDISVEQCMSSSFRTTHSRTGCIGLRRTLTEASHGSGCGSWRGGSRRATRNIRRMYSRTHS